MTSTVFELLRNLKSGMTRVHVCLKRPRRYALCGDIIIIGVYMNGIIALISTKRPVHLGTLFR